MLPPALDAMLADYASVEAAAVCDLLAAANATTIRKLADPYLAMSVLQKAIRLSNPSLAAAAVCSMINGGRQAAAWRRLRVIAVEDVGIGDPAAACFVLWLAGNASLRAKVGDSELALVAIGHLCAATKSRDMSDLAFWISLPDTIAAEMARNATTSTPDLLDRASNAGASFRERIAATRALYPYRFRGQEKWKPRKFEDRMALYQRLNTSPQVAFMIERDVAFGGDALTCTGAMVELLVRSSQATGPQPDPMDRGDGDLVGGVYASAYDRHTRPGLQATRTLLARHEPLRAFFHQRPEAHPMDCLLRAVFYIEGAILRPKLAYDAADDLYWAVLEAKFASTGLPLRPDGLELLELTRAALPDLNRIRRNVARQ